MNTRYANRLRNRIMICGWRATIFALMMLFVVPVVRAEQPPVFQTWWNENLGLFYVKFWKSLALDLSVPERGLLVTGVLKESAADRAGMRRGDLVVGATVGIWKGQDKTGQIKVLRDGKTLSLDVTGTKHTMAGTMLARDDCPRSTPKSIVVDGTGRGDYRTIIGAVLQAEPGDTILVRPGTYREGVLLPSGISIQRSGAGGVRIEAVIPLQFLAARDATVEGLTIRGSRRGISILNCKNISVADCDIGTKGGHGVSVADSVNILLQRCSIRGNEKTHGITLKNTEAKISDTIISGCRQAVLIKDDSRADIEHNLLDGNDDSIAAFDSQLTVKNNVITGKGEKNGIFFETSQALIEGNSIRRHAAGVHARRVRGQIFHNTMSQNNFGIMIKGGAVDVCDNVVLDNRYKGIDIDHHKDDATGSGLANIARNRITGNGLTGIYVANHRAEVNHNLLEGNGTGLAVHGAAANLYNNTVVLQTDIGIDIGPDSQTSVYNNIVAFNAVGIRWDVTSPLTTGFNDVFGNFAKRTFPPQDGNYCRKDRLLTRSGEKIPIVVYPAYDLKASTDFNDEPEFVGLGYDYRLSADSSLAKKKGKDGLFIGALPPVSIP